MGKGISQRRRLKHVVKANEGNLHKAKIGKVQGAAFERLPEAPKKEDMVERVSNSLRKMMKLKAASEAPRKTTAAAGSRAPIKQPLTDQHPSERSTVTGSRSLSVIDATGLDRGPVEVEPPKSLKKQKKDYLSRRKEKKKNKGKAGKNDQTLLEQALEQRGKVRFGERSDAPMEINLKRKHWQKEKSTSERCKDLFLKQVGEAQRRNDALRHGVPASLSSPPSKKQKQSRAGAEPSAHVPEEVRLQAIEAYRAQKKKGPEQGATLTSLAKLVKTAQ